MNRSQALKALAGALVLGAATVAQAAFPDHPVHLVVPFPPGGTTDVVARAIAPKVGEILGQQVVIDNRGGAGGSIATEYVAKANPDGYTLLMPTNSHTANPSIYKHLPFDTAKAFTGVAYIGDTPGFFVVNPSVPVKNVKEFVALAKKSDPPLMFGSAGAGTYPHLAAELFTQEAGIKMTHVPYKGAGPAMIDLLAGVYQFKVEGVPTGWPQVKAGKLKVLGVTSKERLPQFPDIPTVAEQGYPDYEQNFWMGVLVPAGTPEDVRAKLEKAFMEALEDKAVSAKLASLSVRARPMTGKELDALIARELEMWPAVVKKAGITSN